jgi:hypothetical protein
MIAQAQPNLGHAPVAEILQAQSPLARTVRTDRPDTAPPANKRRAAVRRQPIRAGSEVDLPRAGRPERTSSRRLPPPDQIAGAVERVQKPVAAAAIPAKRRFGDPETASGSSSVRTGSLDHPANNQSREGPLPTGELR